MSAPYGLFSGVAAAVVAHLDHLGRVHHVLQFAAVRLRYHEVGESVVCARGLLQDRLAQCESAGREDYVSGFRLCYVRLHGSRPGWVLHIPVVAIVRSEGRVGGFVPLGYEVVDYVEWVRAACIQPV